MRNERHLALYAALLLFGLISTADLPLAAQPADYEQTAAAAGTANAKPGPRQVPAHVIPVPTDEVSPQVQALISAPYTPFFNADPKDAAAWKELVNSRAARSLAALPALVEKFSVSVTPTTIGGVKAFTVTPAAIPEKNRNRLLVHVHGGGYVFFPGEAGLDEAVLMAGFGGFKVISVDYRMPPDFPYPAAMDDAMAVWREVVKTTNPRNTAIFGTSTGGGMTLAMVLRAKDEHLPLPAAIAPGTPWSDLTDTGDSYETNEWVDNVLVSSYGWLGHAARLYAAGHDSVIADLRPASKPT